MWLLLIQTEQFLVENPQFRYNLKSIHISLHYYILLFYKMNYQVVSVYINRRKQPRTINAIHNIELNQNLTKTGKNLFGKCFTYSTIQKKCITLYLNSFESDKKFNILTYPNSPCYTRIVHRYIG